MNKDSLIHVTGGAGFIGSNLVRHLNNAGYKNILVIDDLTDGNKFRNLVGCVFGYVDKDEYIKGLLRDQFYEDPPDYVFHLGAISDTTYNNGKELMENNYQFSIDLISFCANYNIPIQYASSASVYGNNTDGTEDPLNCYAFSKHMVDNFVRDLLMEDAPQSQIIGLRYHNVYGPNEEHKGPQASPIYQFWNKLRTTGSIQIFDVESKRDFIHVDDVCKIHLWLMENRKSGIVDVGTGTSVSFREIALLVLKEVAGKNPLSTTELSELVEKYIRTVPLPEHLLGKYQFFTQGKHCLNAGYEGSLLTIEEGVSQYIRELARRWEKVTKKHI